MRATLAALLLLVPAALVAQEKRGPEFALGAGFGYLRNYYEIEVPDADEVESRVVDGGAETVYGRAMWPVSRKVMLGVEAFYGGGGEEGRRLQDVGGTLGFRWAPNLDRGITVKGGLGLVYSDIELVLPRDGVEEVIDGDLTGMLWSMGLGWNFPIGRTVSLEPMLSVYNQPMGSFQATETILFRNIFTTRYTLGVSIVFH